MKPAQAGLVNYNVGVNSGQARTMKSMAPQTYSIMSNIVRQKQRNQRF